MQDQPSHNTVWFLIARSLGGEASALEKEQLRQLLEHDISLQQQYDLLLRMWQAGDKKFPEATDQQEKNDISRILQLARQEMQPNEEIPFIQTRSRKKYLYALSGIAALLILAALGRIFIGQEKTVQTDGGKTQHLVAENGSRTRTILPDGSTVWLNAGSHISFDDNLSGPVREVTLDGEAYFDVVKQPQRPFIVHVSGYDIKVLGTAFNVKSYPADKTIETTLIRGLVEVTKHGAKKQKPVFLHPNEKLIVDKVAANKASRLPDNNTPASDSTDADFKLTALNSSIKEEERIETAWVHNRLQFRAENFAELAGKMERWYNVKIVFDDVHVQQLNFTGSFEEETVEQAFYALRAARAFDFTINGQEIHIRSAGHIN